MARRVVHFPTIDPMYVLRQAARAKDQTGLVALAAAADAAGASVMAFRGEDIVTSGGHATSWPAFGGSGPVLTPVGDTPIAVAGGLATLDDAQSQYFRDDADSALNVFTDNMALVVVCKLPVSPTAAASPQMACLSDGATSGRLMLSYEDNSTPALIQTLASGTGDPWPEVDYADDAGVRRAYHAARWHSGADQILALQVGRGAMQTVTKAGAPLGTTPCTRLTLGTQRADPADLNPWDFAQMTELSALLVLLLSPEVGYTADLAAAVNTWCETHAGAA